MCKGQNETARDLVLSCCLFSIPKRTPYMSSDIFTYCVCLFCSRIVVKIKEFDVTVIQVRGLASNKSRFNPPFSIEENAFYKSGK